MPVLECQVVLILLRKRNGDWFVHQRLATKPRFPGLFGLGAGGSIEAGEKPDAAARRELFEETGIDAAPSFLFSFEYRGPNHRHELQVYELLTASEPRHDQREWQWSGWLDESRVRQLAAKDQLCPDTKAVLERYLRNNTYAVEGHPFSK